MSAAQPSCAPERDSLGRTGMDGREHQPIVSQSPLQVDPILGPILGPPTAPGERARFRVGAPLAGRFSVNMCQPSPSQGGRTPRGQIRVRGRASMRMP